MYTGLKIVYKTMVLKYKSKSKEFNMKAERTFRKGFNIDAVYFPTYTYIKNDRIAGPTTINEQNILGVLFSLHGNSVKAKDPREHQSGISWRLGGGVMMNPTFIIDLGLGFSF